MHLIPTAYTRISRLFLIQGTTIPGRSLKYSIPLSGLQCVSFGEFFVAGEGGGEGEEGVEVGGFAFVAQGQAPVSGQPGDRAFDDPSVLAQCVAGVDAFASDAGDDSTVPEPGA